MDPVLELPREREEAEDAVRLPEPEVRAEAYVFDGWSYEPLKLAQQPVIS